MSQWISATMLRIYYLLTSSCVTITCWRMLVKWWQGSNIGAFTAVLAAPHNGKCLNSHTENHRFYCSTFFSYFYVSSFVRPLIRPQSTLFQLTDHRHHFVVRDSPQRAPCAPHNNTLKPSIRGHLAPVAEPLSPPLHTRTHTHTQDIYHSLMTDSTKDDVSGRNTTTYNKRAAGPLSSQLDRGDLTWLIGLSLTGPIVPVRPSWYVAHEASMLLLLLLLLLLPMTKSE